MIGLFVLTAIAIVILGVLFIHPNIGNEGSTLRVRFANIDKVSVGTRVTFGGKVVGEVMSIHEIINEQDPRRPHDGAIYVYELELAVNNGIDVYNSDRISLMTSGLLGEKSVNISPRPPRKGEKLVLMNDQILYADEGGSIEDAVSKLKEVSDKINESLNGFIDILVEIKKTEIVKKVDETFTNLADITSELNKPGEWSKLLTSAAGVAEKVDKSWDKVDQVLDSIGEVASDVQEITEQVKHGKGSIGRIVMSDDLYLRLTSLFSKAETLLNDVNHYGPLFHLDKSWQRLRARRLNLLQKLRTPQEFRNFFNDEVDQISTSLSRVYMLLNKNGCPTQCPNLVKDYEFTKVFSELLRRVEEVEEQLKMYNIQLQTTNVAETELSGVEN